MDEILKQLENGEFTQYQHTLELKSGVNIWTASGFFFLDFHPESGGGFSLWEKIKLMAAIKKGRIKQAVTPNHH